MVHLCQRLDARFVPGSRRGVPVKGGKMRDIPLPSAVMQFLHAYIERVRVKQIEKIGPDTPLFWSSWGRRLVGKTKYRVS